MIERKKNEMIKILIALHNSTFYSVYRIRNMNYNKRIMEITITVMINMIHYSYRVSQSVSMNLSCCANLIFKCK